MIARGFKPVAWVAAAGTAALGCYMLSLQVASERAELAALERQIVRVRQDIRSLNTELGTRGRLSQLEQWNAEVLALSAPVAAQFLDSNLSLARFDVREPGPDHRAPVMMAAAPAAPAPAATAVAPPVVLAAAAPVAPPAAAAAPLVRRASLDTLPPAPAALPPAPVRTAAAAVRPAALLDEGTLSALRAESRSERGGGTRN